MSFGLIKKFLAWVPPPLSPVVTPVPVGVNMHTFYSFKGHCSPSREKSIFRSTRSVLPLCVFGVWLLSTHKVRRFNQITSRCVFLTMELLSEFFFVETWGRRRVRGNWRSSVWDNEGWRVWVCCWGYSHKALIERFKFWDYRWGVLCTVETPTQLLIPILCINVF